MKVNEDKAKELIALAHLRKETSYILLNFDSGNKSGSEMGKLRASFEELVHLIGRQEDKLVKLIYETFPE